MFDKHAPIKADSFAKLYVCALKKCFCEPHYENAPRGLKIKELVNQTLILTDPTSNLFSSPERSPDLRYLAGELIWYFAGDNHISFIEKYSAFWKRIMNADGTLNSAYGDLLFQQVNPETQQTQFEWAWGSLVADKDSRQAIFHINQPSHQRSNIKDFPCTIFGQFMIRDNELNLHVTMRSNDFWFGLTYDLPFFTCLQQTMYQLLLPTYQDLKLGSYYHTANSLHIYEKDFDSVVKFLGQFTAVKSDGIPAIIIPPVDQMGNPHDAIVGLFEGNRYTEDDQFFKWLDEKSHLPKG